MARTRSGKGSGIFVYALLLLVAFSFRLSIAKLLPNDEPNDGKVYAQIARNLLERHVYSHATEPPYKPSLIRLPGYPLFLAGIYSVFGHDANTAVRITQALIDTAACALIALVAFYWEPDEKSKRRSSIAALALAAFCPFTTIYVATILTETPTVLLAVAMCLTTTLAFKAVSQRSALLLWATTGILAGLAVLFRPDSGLFAAAIGITLVVAVLLSPSGLQWSSKRIELLYRFSRASYLGALFSLAFCLVLLPWTIRNHRVFHLFQPLAPAHAEMPGEFVPRGYLSWVRTWIDDGSYVGPILWALDEAPITLDEIPDRAFDSVDEKKRVSVLLEKYNHPPDEPEPDSSGFEPEASPAKESDKQTGDNSNSADGESEKNDGANQGNEAEDEDKTDEADSSQSTDEAAEQQFVQMTPEIDAEFAKLAAERISRNPVRHYFVLPLKRARSLWFDTHSEYYPFEGSLLPLDNLDYQTNQQFWLALFAGLTFLYTVLGIAGAWFLWESGEFEARKWFLLAALMVFLRLGFFATLENPEPRYVVELFPFLSILGGIALARILASLGARLGSYAMRKRKTA